MLTGNEIANHRRLCDRLTGCERLASLVGREGAVAQLGERRVRNAEVRGSIPLCSMIAPWCNWQHV